MKHVDDFLNEAIFQNIMMRAIATIALQLLVCNFLIVPVTMLLMHHADQWVFVGIGSNLILFMMLSWTEFDRLEAVEKAKQKQREEEEKERWRSRLK